MVGASSGAGLQAEPDKVGVDEGAGLGEVGVLVGVGLSGGVVVARGLGTRVQPTRKMAAIGRRGQASLCDIVFFYSKG